MQVHAGCPTTLKCHLVVFFLLSIYILFYSSRPSEAGYLLFKSYQHTNPCCASILHSLSCVFLCDKTDSVFLSRCWICYWLWFKTLLSKTADSHYKIILLSICKQSALCGLSVGHAALPMKFSWYCGKVPTSKLWKFPCLLFKPQFLLKYKGKSCRITCICCLVRITSARKHILQVFFSPYTFWNGLFDKDGGSA